MNGMENGHVIVLFGATGDLSRRKLLPGLMHLWQAGLIDDSRIVGTSLEDIDTDEFVRIARGACDEFSKRGLTAQEWDDFARLLSYVPQSAGPPALAEAVRAAEADLARGGRPVDFLHYLSVPPKAALDVVRQLDEAGLVKQSRIVMEKPLRTDP